MTNVTFIIKTFERFFCVKRLVKSIYHCYPNAIVLIGDDSKCTCKDYFKKKYAKKNLKVFELEKDCGLSYGRDFLLQHVQTPYFVLLDDDFVFDKQTDIDAGLSMLLAKNIDIIGGYFRTYITETSMKSKLQVFKQLVFGKPTWQNYIGTFSIDKDKNIFSADYESNRFPPFEMTDIVHNFFIAKTSIVRDVNPWDNDLKLQEHTAFFYQAKINGLKVGFTNALSVQHRPVYTPQYQSYRGRNYFHLFLEKNNIGCFMSTMNGINQTPIFCEKCNHFSNK